MRNSLRYLLICLILGFGAKWTFTNSEDTQAVAVNKPSHHSPDGGYRNPPGSPARDATFGEMVRFIAGELFSSHETKVPEDHVLPKAEFERQYAEAGNPSVTWLGHAAFIIRLGGQIILTDPFLSDVAGPMSIGPKRYALAPLSGAELPKADVLLISHNHYDHLDASTIEAYRYKEETQVIVPLGLAPFFTKRGYTRVTEHDWWQSWQSDGIEITTLPAVHFSGRGIGDRGKTLWASFGISTPEGKIWFSGDTANGTIFEEIGRRAGPFDMALIAIGAYEPRNIMKSVHVTPEEAIEVVRKVGARRAIGMHWGVIMLTPENPFDAPQRFKLAAEKQGLGNENALILRVGESISIFAETHVAVHTHGTR